MGETADNKPKALGRGISRRKKAALLVIAVCLAAGAAWYYFTSGPGGQPRADMTLDLGNGVTMKLMLIPAGKFTMGSPSAEPGRCGDEGPEHQASISKPFYMGIYTVTQEQYEQVMGTNPSYFKGAHNPVETVSWDDAVEFCKKLSQKTGKRVKLPTEAQWEYACRAGKTTAYNTGATLGPGQADCDFSSSKAAPGYWEKFKGWVQSFFPSRKQLPGGPKPVGSFKPNGFGLYDMHGNIWQWCADWYSEDYYAESPNTDPQGPANGSLRVLRGGCWYVNPTCCRSAGRIWYSPGFRDFSFGFRVAVDLK